MQARLSLDDYILHHSKPLPFQSIPKGTFDHPLQHQMCGPIVGHFLSQLVLLHQPQHILEVGTMLGYSTLFLAQHLPAEGRIDTIEIRAEDAARAAQLFTHLNLAHRIQQHVGDALILIPQMLTQWDMVFLDADKSNIVAYYEMIVPNMKKNGIIVIDNVLFYEQVINPLKNSKNIKAIRALNDTIVADERVHNVILNVRDGLQFIIKR